MKRLIVVLVAAAAMCVVFGPVAAQAGGKAHAYGKHKIKGEHVDMAAVKKLLDESTEPGYVEVGRSGKYIAQIQGKFKVDKSKPIEDAALDLIDRHGHAFGLEHSKEELKVDKSTVNSFVGGGAFTINKYITEFRYGIKASAHITTKMEMYLK